MRAAISPKTIPKRTVAIRLTAAKRCRNERPGDSSDRPVASNALASGHPRGSIQYLTGRKIASSGRGEGLRRALRCRRSAARRGQSQITEATEVRGVHTPTTGGCLGASEECDDDTNVPWNLATASLSLAQPVGRRQGRWGLHHLADGNLLTGTAQELPSA